MKRCLAFYQVKRSQLMSFRASAHHCYSNDKEFMVDLQADRESKSEFQHIGATEPSSGEEEMGLPPNDEIWELLRTHSTKCEQTFNACDVSFSPFLSPLANRRDDHEKNLKDATDLASL
jgi:hypothetical protein